MKKCMCALLTVLLFLGLATTVWADDGRGQVVFPGSNVVVGPNEVIQNDVAVLGGTLEVQEGGRIRGDVTVLGGNSVVDGQIEGDFVLIGGNLDLQSHAVLDGDLVTFGGNVTRAEGAVVRGQRIDGFRGRFPTIRVMPGFPFSQPWRWSGDTSHNLFGNLVRVLMTTLAMMTLGALLVLFLPRQMGLVGKTVTKTPFESFGVGLLTMLVLPILLLLLIVICIGIPVAVLLVLVAVAAGIFGWAAVAAVMGHYLLVALRAQAVPVLEVIVGIGVLALLIEVPCLGWLLGFIVAAAGLGAVVLTRFGTMPYRRQAQPPGVPQPPSGPVAPGSPEQKPQAQLSSEVPGASGAPGQAEPETPGAPGHTPQG